MLQLSIIYATTPYNPPIVYATTTPNYLRYNSLSICTLQLPNYLRYNPQISALQLPISYATTPHYLRYVPTWVRHSTKYR
jgi:hypothetical protein